MTCAILWLVASAAFGFGWALRALTRPPMDTHTRRILMDWGAAHRLLDRLQVATQERDLAPRVRMLVDYLAATAGWPEGGPPPPDRFGPRTWPPEPVDDDDLPTPPFRVV